MINKEIVLVCNTPLFYSKNDEVLMLQWLKKIKCINAINRIDEIFYLHIGSDKISNNDLDNLIGLFNRYHCDSEQLKIFINPTNNQWFSSVDGVDEENYHNVYPKRQLENPADGEVVLFCTPLRFYTKKDEDLMFRLIKKIKCITKCYGIGEVLYLVIRPSQMTRKYLADLKALFMRYRFDIKQLEVFTKKIA